MGGDTELIKQNKLTIQRWVTYLYTELASAGPAKQLTFINNLRLYPDLAFSLRPADVLFMLPIYQPYFYESSKEFDFILALFNHFSLYDRDQAVLKCGERSSQIISALKKYISPAAYLLLTRKNLSQPEEKALRALAEHRLNYRTYILSKMNPDSLDNNQKELVQLWNFLEQHDTYKHLLLDISKQYPSQDQSYNLKPDLLSAPPGKISRDKTKEKNDSNTSTLITPNGTYAISHDVLGKGGYGKVKKVKNLLPHTHKPAALKIFTYNPDYPVIQNAAENAVAILSELGMLQDHCIVTDSKNRTKHYVIMDKIPGGNLLNILFDNNNGTKIPMPFFQKIFYAKALVQKITLLHKLGYIIRDMKTNNFLLDLSNNINPINPVDFDTWGNINNNLPGTKTYSPGYAAPELETRPQTQASDKYAIGVILAEMFTPHNEEIDDSCKTPGKHFKHVEKYLKNEPTDSYKKRVWRLCLQLVSHITSMRPALDRVYAELQSIQIAYISQINNTKDLLANYNNLLQSKAIAPPGSLHVSTLGQILTGESSDDILNKLKEQFLKIALAKAKEGKADYESISAQDFQNALKQIKTQVNEQALLDFLNHNRNVIYDEIKAAFFDSKEPQTTGTYRSFVKATTDEKEGLAMAAELLNKAQYGSFA